MNRKTMKKGMVCTLVMVMLLTLLSGCSLGKATDTNEGGDKKLQIGVVARGYGDEYLKKLAEAFTKKTGIETVLAKSTYDPGAMNSQVVAGPKHNQLDVIFDINAAAFASLAKVNYVEGYERAFATLNDVYDSVAEGYGTDKTIKELFFPYALNACTWGGDEAGFGDGNQYFISYATSLEGLIYNVDLFEKYNLSEPKTTNEFFALMDQMKRLGGGTYPKNEEGYAIYPYVFSGQVNYTSFLSTVWWAQYDGVDNFNRALEGKDAKGVYTANSLKSPGKLSAFNLTSKLLAANSGYWNLNNFSASFTNTQLAFLDKQAFMMSSGEWIEREMENNFAGESMNIAFMRIPVNSDIVQKCDSVTDEEKLVETIAYIDGDTNVRPSYLSDADLTRISEARSVYNSEGNQHIAYIPAYSNMVEEAKEFLKFFLSKEGQEIMSEYSYGNTAPLNVDVTSFKTYESMSVLQKSKYNMLTSQTGLTLVGNNYYHPMAYVGGVRAFYNTPTMETAFGTIETSDSYKTPLELWEAEYNMMKASWERAMKNAGVSN